jgi:hypothetical protein
MKRLVVVAMVMIAGGSCWASLLTDLSPAPFRGEEGSTLQAWSFGTPNPVVTPDVSQNQNGVATVTMTGGFWDNTIWEAEDMGHTGVWVIDSRDTSDMIINIPNFPNQNQIKKIWVQIVYSAAGYDGPVLYVLPEGIAQPPIAKMQLVNTVQLDPYYTHATFSLEIRPNPRFEQIIIRPRYATMRIDEIIVETQCIPEPMTMVLFGVGALMTMRKRS